MKKSIFILVLTAALFANCNQTSQNSSWAIKSDSLQAVIDERDAAMQELISIINFVEEGFRAINEAQGRINSSAMGYEVSRKDIIAGDLSFINQTLAKNKAEIEKLKAAIDNNKVASAQLKQMINNLQKQLVQKSEEIASMRELLASKDYDIAKLNTTLSELSHINEHKEHVIQFQEEELNTVWYAIGTKRELRDEKILKDGDVLLEKDANFDYFTKALKNELTTINTHAKRAKLLTSHPEDSYTLTRDENKQYILTITNPQRFWELSRYLVIQVKL